MHNDIWWYQHWAHPHESRVIWIEKLSGKDGGGVRKPHSIRLILDPLWFWITSQGHLTKYVNQIYGKIFKRSFLIFISGISYFFFFTLWNKSNIHKIIQQTTIWSPYKFYFICFSIYFKYKALDKFKYCSCITYLLVFTNLCLTFFLRSSFRLTS